MQHTYSLRFAGKWVTRIAFVSILSLNGLSASAQNETIIYSDFNKKKETRRAGFKGKYSVTSEGGSSAIVVKADNKKKRWVVLPLALERVRGRNIRISARIKAENVSEPAHSYNGIKIMLQLQLPWENRYPQLDMPRGSFDWRNVSFTTFLPAETEMCNLVLGLEESNGKVWFDNIEVKEEGPALHATPQASFAPYKGHSLPRLRGTMITPFAPPKDLQTLASWGANVVRWQMMWGGFPHSKADTASLGTYMNWLNSNLDHVSRMMALCRQLGIKVVIDLHTLPGGFEGHNLKLFKEKHWQDAFVDIWRQIAEKFKDEPAVWGYDLANEPIEGTPPPGVMNWHDLATAAAKEIRKIDTTHAIIVEGNTGAEPIGLPMIKPIPVPGVVYSIHVYNPFEFAGQGLDGSPANISYPGLIAGRQWNKQMLRRSLQMIVDWQRHYNAHIYVGEFSAIRWAPGESTYNYLKDCIEIFEELGWDWTYHAFREFDGWSVEHTTDRNNPNPSPTVTNRQQLLMDWFRKNER